MDISIIEESRVTHDFEVLDEKGEVVDVLTVTYDRNKFTGEYDRRQGRLYRERVTAIDTRMRASLTSVQATTSKNAQKKRLKRKSPAKVEQLKEVVAGKPSILLQMADAFVEKKEVDALCLDISREVIADSLAADRYGVIKAWSMTRQQQPVEPSYDNLVRLPLSFLGELQEFLRTAVLPKAVRMLRVRTTSDNIDATSPSEPDTPIVDSLPM